MHREALLFPGTAYILAQMPLNLENTLKTGPSGAAESRLRPYLPWIVAGGVAHIIAAWWSLGPHQFDEHFQILEFLSYKLGTTPEKQLPWEFSEQIRPWIQVAFLYELARLDQLVGITDPILMERTFRLVLAGLGFASSLGISFALRGLFRTERFFRWLIIAQCLYWPVVYVHARLSAEALGATVFVFGLYAAMLGNGRLRRIVLSGGLLGVAFMIRFQLGFAIAGLGLYLLLRERWTVTQMLTWIAGFAASVMLCVAVDVWGYGGFVFTPWRYFAVNIMEGRAAEFGLQPVWWYVPEIAAWLVPPFSIAVMAGALWFFVRHRWHVVTWIVVPFLAAHLAVGHKEFRFLFSLVTFVPFFFLLPAERLYESPKRWLRSIGASGTWAYAAVAAVLLLPMTTHTAKLPMRYFMHVNEHHRDGYSPLWKDREPMGLTGLQVYFYRPTDYAPERIDAWGELERASSERPLVFYHLGDELPPAAGAARGRCTAAVRTVPDIAFTVGVAHLISPDLHWTLFECNPAR